MQLNMEGASRGRGNERCGELGDKGDKKAKDCKDCRDTKDAKGASRIGWGAFARALCAESATVQSPGATPW